jgi:nitroimidazol reductase NimA-like FMN-containing flavoprotein (pyridoxamine 5'-phosphate oxidase superfamily)
MLRSDQPAPLPRTDKGIDVTHELRRADRQITHSADIDRILATAKYAMIALADGDQPYVVTLSCGYDPERQRLCFHSAPRGRKLDIIGNNPLACATVVREGGYKSGECAHPFESVVLFGRMRVLDDPDDARAAMRTLIGQLESTADRDALWQRHDLDTAEALARFRMLAFEIEHLTAKSGQ